MQKDIANKATKIELQDLKKENKEAHDKFINRSEFEMLMSIMNGYNDSQKIMRSDIKEILQRLPKK